MENKDEVGKALGRVASGLFILTAKCDDREDAVLASWVNQCAFDPPAVSVALATVRPARLLVEGSNKFVLNILAKESNDLLKRFSRPSEGDLFEGVQTREGFNAIKILTDSVSYLECEVKQSVSAGDHVVYIAEVVGGEMLKGGDPFTHVRKNGFGY